MDGHNLVAVYNSRADAERARDRLLAFGIPATDIRLSSALADASAGAAHTDTDLAVSLRDLHNLVREQHFDVGQLSQTLKNKLGGFELLALNNEWMIGVPLEDDMIELGNLLAAWPVPKLEDGRHQAHAGHVIRKAVLDQQIERGGMGCGRPWIRLQGFVDVE